MQATCRCWNTTSRVAHNTLHGLGMPMRFFVSDTITGILVDTVTDVCVDYTSDLSPSCPLFRILDGLPTYEEALGIDLVFCSDILCPCCVFRSLV